MQYRTSSDQTNPPKALPWLMYGGMMAILALSIIYYKERVGFTDTPEYIVRMVNNGGFYIAHTRFIGLMTQWLPALLIKLHCSLRSIAIAYSFCYNFTPIILALVARHTLKQPYTCLAIILFFTVMESWLFYFPVSELQTGISLLIFYNGLYDYYGSKARRGIAFLVLSGIILPTIAFSHPTAFLAFIIWVGYRLLLEPRQANMLVIPVSVFGLAYIVKQVWFVSGYESSLAPHASMLRDWGWKYYSGGIATTFYHYLLADAFWMPVLFAAVILLLARAKRYLMIVYYLAGLAAVFTIMLLKFENFSTMFYQHYIEHTFQPMVFLTVILLCRWLPYLRLNEWIQTGALALLLVLCICKISSFSEPHIRRQEWLARVMAAMDKKGIKKGILNRDWIPEGLAKGDFWNESYESLLLSSLDGPAHSKTLLMAWTGQLSNPRFSDATLFLLDGWERALSEIVKPGYFALPASQYIYLEQVIPKDSLRRMMYP